MLACAPGATGRDARVLGALDRALGWLEQHAVDPASAPLGVAGYDVWTWHLFATRHPDAGVRERARRHVTRRLARLPAPAEWTVVSLSYWALLLRIGQLHDTPLPAEPAVPSGAELDRILRTANPTTDWWTRELLRRSGLPVEPDASGTLLERGPAAPAYEPDRAGAYGIFHEIVPATDLGAEPPRLSAGQLAFVRRSLPGWIAASRAQDDTDALAEALVVAHLSGARDDEALDWLLSRQRDDGTFEVANRDAQGPDDYRHVVLVASFGLLTALDDSGSVVGMN